MIKPLTPEQIAKVLADHRVWLHGEGGGQRADLRWADLRWADLPFCVMQIGPIGSRSDYLIYRFDTGAVYTGCFSGTLDEFAAAVERTHGNNRDGQDYRAAIAMLRALIVSEEATQ